MISISKVSHHKISQISVGFIIANDSIGSTPVDKSELMERQSSRPSEIPQKIVRLSRVHLNET